MEEFSLTKIIFSLNLIELIVLLMVGAVLFFLSLSMRTHILMFTLVLSASLVGSTIPIVDNIAALVRWVSISLLLIAVIRQRRFKAPPALLLFWGYITLGFVSLFDAISPIWQLQKGILLLAVAVTIPLAYSNETHSSLRLSLVSISLAATVYCLLSFISLPGQLSEAERFSGYAKGAPSFAMFLGGLLPFTFWGLWRANHRVIRMVCGSGFLCGSIALIFTGQRTGTIGGMIGLIPLLLTFVQRRNIVKFAFVIIFTVLLSYVLLQHSSEDFVNFLSVRYSPESGLSGRESIWGDASSEIAKSPLLGRGIGAAETVISDSFHNAYLEIWFNTGLAGLLLFLASLCCFTCRILYLKRICKDPEIRSILALALGYIMGFVAMSFSESIAAEASNLNLMLYLFLGGLVSNRDLIVQKGLRSGVIQRGVSPNNHFFRGQPSPIGASS